MGAGGKVDFNDLKIFRDKLKKHFDQTSVDEFIDSCAKELAARLLAKVVKRTPTGQYPKGSGKVGGTLKRGWTAGKSQGAAAYANELKVHHFGDAYVIEIVNPVEYAPYVEYGHRTRSGDGWVEGKFMLTISEREVQANSTAIIEKKLRKKLGDFFG